MTVPSDHPTFGNAAAEIESFAAALVELLSCVAERQVAPRNIPVKSLRRKLTELL